MAIKKYILDTRDISKHEIGIKYNVITGHCVVGGYTSEADIMCSIIHDYFGYRKDPNIKMIAKNKIRYEFKLPFKKYMDALRKFQDYGTGLQEVKVLGRLMR